MSSKYFAIKRDLDLLKMRVQSQRYFVYQGGLWSADFNLLNMIHHSENGDVLLDTNHTPCKIDDMKDFYQTARQTQQKVLNEYRSEYKKIVQ